MLHLQLRMSQPELSLLAAMPCHAATSAVSRGTVVGAPDKNRLGSAGKMFPALVPRLWNCCLHQLAMKWSKSGSIPGMPQKTPIQEGQWRELGAGFLRLAVGAKECFSRRWTCRVPSGISIKYW